MSVIQELFDQVYVINLPNRRDRKQAIVEKMAAIGIEFKFFEATNGYLPEYKREFDKYYSSPIGGAGAHKLEIEYNKKLISSPGAWGYLKTYERLLEDAKTQGFARILCFDDDVLFSRYFDDQVREFFNSIGDSWKLVYLGATQHVWNLSSSFSYQDRAIEKYDPNQAFYHPIATDGSFAVGIDANIYEILLEEIRHYNAPFDSGPLRRINELFPSDCYVAQPNSVIADVTNSDISSDRDQFVLAEKLKWDLDLFDFPFEHSLVSVIIPAFNAGNSIEASIRSILNQTYPFLEVIVVDDASEDDTVEVVERLLQEDDRIKLLKNTENRGCYFVRNDAIRSARGKFIAIQDADDVSLSTRIEKQIVPLLKGEAKFSLTNIYRSRCSIEELSRGTDEEILALVEKRRKPNREGKYEYKDRAILGFGTSMYHRSLFEELGLFWEKRFAGDAEFAERVLFFTAGIKLEGNENIHSFLMDCDAIDGVYKKNDEVLYVCAEMNDSNITNSFRSEQKKQFEKEWRDKFDGNSMYQYPVLSNSHRPNFDEKKQVDLRFLRKMYQTKIDAKDKIIEASRKRAQDLENDLAWYGRTYDHLPKWYLKIGGIFRRFNPWK